MSDSIPFDLPLRQSRNVLAQRIQDEMVLLHLKQEKYFELDSVGSRMWELMTTSDSVQSAEASLLAEYDVAADQLRQDLADFVGRLIENDLAEVVCEK